MAGKFPENSIPNLQKAPTFYQKTHSIYKFLDGHPNRYEKDYNGCNTDCSFSGTSTCKSENIQSSGSAHIHVPGRPKILLLRVLERWKIGWEKAGQGQRIDRGEVLRIASCANRRNDTEEQHSEGKLHSNRRDVCSKGIIHAMPG